jgi:purine-nucleoside phosphorylase
MHTHSQALAVLASHVQELPAQTAILGSGWKRVLEGATIETEISFEEWLGVKASVPGHDGKLVIAKINGSRVAVMSGRIHMYEGYTAREATLPVRVLAEAGAKELVVTAAAGALNPKYQVGEFVLLSDLLTLFLSLNNPLLGPEFLDMSSVFEPVLVEKMRAALTTHQAPFKEGVYAYVHGPNFETATDKLALRALGADVVGMSTVPEVLAARWAQLKVVGLALVTNLAFVKHDHKDVLAAAEAASDQMANILGEYFGNRV